MTLLFSKQYFFAVATTLLIVGLVMTNKPKKCPKCDKRNTEVLERKETRYILYCRSCGRSSDFY